MSSMMYLENQLELCTSKSLLHLFDPFCLSRQAPLDSLRASGAKRKTKRFSASGSFAV